MFYPLYAIRYTQYAIQATSDEFASTTVENPLQISSFLTNKANFRKSQMNVSIFLQKAYENISDWTLGENKPNSKPIKANLQNAKMNVTAFLTKKYENKLNWALFENKPNTNPIQTQTKPTCSELVEPISKAKKSVSINVPDTLAFTIVSGIFIKA